MAYGYLCSTRGRENECQAFVHSLGIDGGRHDRFAVGSGTTAGVVAFVGRSVGQSVNSLSTSSTQKRRSSVNRGRVSIQIYNLIQESSGSGLQQQLTRILNDCVDSVSALNILRRVSYQWSRGVLAKQ